MEVERIEKFEITPLNQPSGGRFSYKEGNPVITFQLGAVNKYLRPSSLRVNGEFRVKKSDGSFLNNKSLVSGGTPPAASDVSVNSRVAIDSVIQNCTISSASSNQSLESIRQYGRMLATLVPSTMGSGDLLSQQGVVRHATGQQGSADVMLNNKTSFSLKLFAGLLNSGMPIPMSANITGGLQFQLELASDQQVLFGANASDSGGCSYELTNLSLSGDYIVVDPASTEKLASAQSGAMAYNSFGSLYSVLNASDSTQSFNLASSQVLSFFANYIPVSHVNSYSQDGFSTGELFNKVGADYSSAVDIKKVSYSRGGLKVGLDYDLDCEDQSASGIPETGLQVNALSAVQKYSGIRKMLNQPLLFPFGQNDNVIFDDGIQGFSTVDAKRNFATGLAFDHISQSGVSFKDQALSQRIQSTSDGNSPMGTYLFYKAKNVLQYSPQGIQIMS